MRIAYNIVGGFSFYERAEVKDVIAYLKLAMNPFDDIALLRVINTPTRGFGKTSLDELQTQAKSVGSSLWMAIASVTDPDCSPAVNLTPRAKQSLGAFRKVVENLIERVRESNGLDRPVSDVVIAAIEDTGYANALRIENTDEAMARLENLEELINAAVDYDRQEENGLRDFIDHAALVSDTDKYDGTAPVTLMTVHMAKGLEFPVVFIVGLEDGIFPHSRSINDSKELEEERRLAYVAITRAEKILYVTHSMRRRVYGEEMAAEPSQFLNEMPLELIQDLSTSASWLSYARSTSAIASKATVSALRGETAPPKPKNVYAGKTYNSSEAIAEFFKKKGSQESEVSNPERTGERPASAGGFLSEGESSKPLSAYEKLRAVGRRPVEAEREVKPASAFDKLKAAGTKDPQSAIRDSQSLVPGTNVRHEKYGRGLVLRREGSGDNTKLTVSFPGFGQKKLIEKYANLQKD